MPIHSSIHTSVHLSIFKVILTSYLNVPFFMESSSNELNPLA